MVSAGGCTLSDTCSGRACSESGGVERHRNGTQVGTEKSEPKWSSGCPQCSSGDVDSHVRGSAAPVSVDDVCAGTIAGWPRYCEWLSSFPPRNGGQPLRNAGPDCAVQTVVQWMWQAQHHDCLQARVKKTEPGKRSYAVVRRRSDAGDVVCRRRSPRKTAAPVADFR